MTKLAWTPWHKVVKIRPDLKSGELSLNIFAADLYDVAMGKAKPVYQDPREFFSLTYPTFNLRELAKDVVLRLAGKSDKAVRQLELTYGGGKTHSLITLWHLVERPGETARPAGGEGVHRAYRDEAAQGAHRGAAVRQARCREGDGRARAEGRDKMAQESVERDRLSNRRCRRPAIAASR